MMGWETDKQMGFPIRMAFWYSVYVLPRYLHLLAFSSSVQDTTGDVFLGSKITFANPQYP